MGGSFVGGGESFHDERGEGKMNFHIKRKGKKMFKRNWIMKSTEIL
jgi:hypothetical protein